MATSRRKQRSKRRQRAAEPESYEEELGAEDDEDRRHQNRLMASVVKVLCTHAEPNFSLPWQMRRQNQSASTGFVIDVKLRHIITNAHSVEHHTQVKLKRRGSDDKYVATVLAIGRECDIALLTVKDDAFWAGLQPLSFGPLPELQEAVAVVGYPIGGETISVTSGVVSRIEVTSYVHGRDELLGIQIDAAINSGNSGGPAFNESGECIGIAFQSMAGSGDAENIGYVIPSTIVNHFLTDFKANSRYTGFPALGICWQPMESPDLRKSLGLATDEKGVLIRRVARAGAASGKLLGQDVILSVDGVVSRTAAPLLSRRFNVAPRPFSKERGMLGFRGSHAYRPTGA